MKIAVVIANNNVFPVAPKKDIGFGYGGYSRFYEGLAYGMNELGGEHELWIVGPMETKRGVFAKNVVKLSSKIRCSKESYLTEMSLAINRFNPDRVIIQNPSLIRSGVVNNFKHVCRVAGYLYHGFINDDKVNYVVNSNWLNVHYNKSFPVIYQTCCPTDVEYCDSKEDYWLFVSNLSRGFKEKGLDFACRFAAKRNIRLLVAGPVGGDTRSLIKMRSLTNDCVSYVGPIVGGVKKDFIKKAKGIFYPIDKSCKESGSTIVVEAAFCGTPVVTTNVGCMPEYVNNGVTGFVCNNPADFKVACNDISNISHLDCLEWAKKNFAQEKIAKQYLEELGV
jgi:glycosyltransferase involved in cell wall biosynthesis